jgi:hypothetical protein
MNSRLSFSQLEGVCWNYCELFEAGITPYLFGI